MFHISIIIATISLRAASTLAGPVPRGFDQREVRDNVEILARGDIPQSSQSPSRLPAHPTEAFPATRIPPHVLEQLRGANTHLDGVLTRQHEVDAALDTLDAARREVQGDHVTRDHLNHAAKRLRDVSALHRDAGTKLEQIYAITHEASTHLQSVTHANERPRFTHGHHATAIAHPAEVPPAGWAPPYVLKQLDAARISLQGVRTHQDKAIATLDALDAARLKGGGDHHITWDHLNHIDKTLRDVSALHRDAGTKLEQISIIPHETATHLERATQSRQLPTRPLDRLIEVHHESASELKRAANFHGITAAAQIQTPPHPSLHHFREAGASLERAERRHDSAITQLGRIAAAIPGGSSSPQRKRKQQAS